MVWLILIGFNLLVILANVLLGMLIGFRLGGPVLGAILVAGSAAIVNGQIKKNRETAEAALREQHKKEDAQKNTEEAKKAEFEKLPAWKRVELMKQQEQKEQKS